MTSTRPGRGRLAQLTATAPAVVLLKPPPPAGFVDRDCNSAAPRRQVCLTFVAFISCGWDDAASRVKPEHSEMSTGQAASGVDRLTRREREILELVADAQTNDAIAARLGITRRAVERHVNSIFRKLEIRDEGGINRRVRAALLYRGL